MLEFWHAIICSKMANNCFYLKMQVCCCWKPVYFDTSLMLRYFCSAWNLILADEYYCIMWMMVCNTCMVELFKIYLSFCEWMFCYCLYVLTTAAFIIYLLLLWFVMYLSKFWGKRYSITLCSPIFMCRWRCYWTRTS